MGPNTDANAVYPHERELTIVGLEPMGIVTVGGCPKILTLHPNISP